MYSNNHTYTHNVVDGVEAASPVLGINSHKNYHLSGSSNKSGSTSTCSTLSLDGSTLQQSISPIHSPQSGFVVNNSVAAGAALGYNGDNLISTTTNTLQTPPPPPPPPPLPTINNNNYNTIFNENKENKQNTYNRTPLVKNAYNQLLKEYSNKMQTQSNYNENGYNNNYNKNMTPKPFRAQSQLQS